MVQLSLEEKRDILKNHFLLCHLRDWDLERLARHSRISEIPAGETIFRKYDPGDTMIVVIKGRVVICSHSVDGREVVFNIINPRLHGSHGQRTYRAARPETPIIYPEYPDGIG